MIYEVSFCSLPTPIPLFSFSQLWSPTFTFSATSGGSCLSSEPLTTSRENLGLFPSNMPYFRHISCCILPAHVLGDFLPCWSVVSRISPKILCKNSFISTSSLGPSVRLHIAHSDSVLSPPRTSGYQGPHVPVVCYSRFFRNYCIDLYFFIYMLI